MRYGRRALIVGGTGLTGPLISDGLLDRGYEVVVLHTGAHEVRTDLRVQHVHADARYRDELDRFLADEWFDVVVAQHGRLRLVADAVAGHARHLVATGGATRMYARSDDPRWGSAGRPVLVPEGCDVLVDGPGEQSGIAWPMVLAKRELFRHYNAGDYAATYVAYPKIYGPRDPLPYDWLIVRRVLDGRRRFVIADGGVKLESRVYSKNAASAILRCIECPELAAGCSFNMCDQYTYTMSQRIEAVANAMDQDMELLSVPYDQGWPCHALWRNRAQSSIVTSERIRLQLGFEDPIAGPDAIAETVRWLVRNRPIRKGDVEIRLGDQFDYAAEDRLMASIGVGAP